MAGKIIADTLEHSTAGSLSTEYVVNGSAKAWFDIEQTGTHSLPDSLNCSSVTDLAVGQSQVFFTASMANSNWAIATNCSQSANDWVHSKYLTSNFGSGSCDWVAYDYSVGWVDGYGGGLIMGELA